MNRTKTKELLKDFYLPSIDDDDDDIIHSVVQCDRSLKPIAEVSEERLSSLITSYPGSLKTTPDLWLKPYLHYTN